MSLMCRKKRFDLFVLEFVLTYLNYNAFWSNLSFLRSKPSADVFNHSFIA